MAEFLSLAAGADLVQDGDIVALGGMTLYRRPAAFVRALLSRKAPPHDLTLLNFTAGYESDLLVGAGCVSRVHSVYFGLESFGLAPMFTDAAADGRITVVEETEASIVMGLRAQIAGVGFMPSRAWIGTDLPRLRPDVKMINDPYTGQALMAFPAIPLDVAVIHGLEADRFGTVSINNNTGIDLELAYAAKTVIATVERIVPECAPHVESTLIPAPGADYIIEVERGAWPTSCYPDYPVAGGELLRYLDFCSAGNFEQYLDDMIDRSRQREGGSNKG